MKPSFCVTTLLIGLLSFTPINNGGPKTSQGTGTRVHDPSITTISNWLPYTTVKGITARSEEL